MTDESELDLFGRREDTAAVPLYVYGHVCRVLMTIDYPVYQRHRLPAVIPTPPLSLFFLLDRGFLFAYTAIARAYLLRTPIRSPAKGSHISADLV